MYLRSTTKGSLPQTLRTRLIVLVEIELKVEILARRLALEGYALLCVTLPEEMLGRDHPVLKDWWSLVQNLQVELVFRDS